MNILDFSIHIATPWNEQLTIINFPEVGIALVGGILLELIMN